MAAPSSLLTGETTENDFLGLLLGIEFILALVLI